MWGRNFVIILTLLSFTGCTAMRPIEDFSPSTIQEEVHVGDWVSVLYGSGPSRYDFRVTGVDAEALHGVTEDGQAYKFPLEKVKSIKVQRNRVGATIGTGVGIAVTAFIILLILSLKNWDPGGGGESGGGGGD